MTFCGIKERESINIFSFTTLIYPGLVLDHSSVYDFPSMVLHCGSIHLYDSISVIRTKTNVNLVSVEVT